MPETYRMNIKFSRRPPIARTTDRCWSAWMLSPIEGQRAFKGRLIGVSSDYSKCWDHACEQLHKIRCSWFMLRHHKGNLVRLFEAVEWTGKDDIIVIREDVPFTEPETCSVINTVLLHYLNKDAGFDPVVIFPTPQLESESDNG